MDLKEGETFEDKLENKIQLFFIWQWPKKLKIFQFIYWKLDSTRLVIESKKYETGVTVLSTKMFISKSIYTNFSNNDNDVMSKVKKDK